MTRIATTFAALREEGRAGLVPYVMAGHPVREATVPAVLALIEAGADMVELGVPFSDPVADGPTIQSAGVEALRQGVLLPDVLEMVGAIRAQAPDTPLVTMTYVNPVFSMGYESFCGAAREAGLDGMIVPDLPVEESAPLVAAADAAGLAVIGLLAPTSIPDRIDRVSAASRELIYYVSRLGVTGARASLDDDLLETLTFLRKRLALPFVVGFGISTPEHAALVGRHVDGVVVGSALVAAMHEARTPEAAADAARRFIGPLAQALRQREGARL